MNQKFLYIEGRAVPVSDEELFSAFYNLTINTAYA